MGRGYNTIAFDAAKCDGCGDCMTACASAKTGTEDKTRSRIQIVGSADADALSQSVDSRLIVGLRTIVDKFPAAANAGRPK